MLKKELTTLKNIEYILLDLDGTLTDSAEGITNSARFALQKMGTEPKGDLKYFIGPPLYDTFKEYYGYNKEESDKAISYFREYFSSKGVYEHSLYDGILETLQSLKSKGKHLVLATSKPEIFAESILDQYKIKSLFTFVCGASLDETRCEKTDVIKYALEKIAVQINENGENTSNLPLTEICVMVGDRSHDINGANNCRLKSIGVTYGFGSFQELKKSGATKIISKPIDLLEVIE